MIKKLICPVLGHKSKSKHAVGDGWECRLCGHIEEAVKWPRPETPGF